MDKIKKFEILDKERQKRSEKAQAEARVEAEMFCEERQRRGEQATKREQHGNIQVQKH